MTTGFNAIGVTPGHGVGSSPEYVVGLAVDEGVSECSSAGVISGDAAGLGVTELGCSGLCNGLGSRLGTGPGLGVGAGVPRRDSGPTLMTCTKKTEEIQRRTAYIVMKQVKI